MAERLTISSGEITFYADTYNKCSNKNANKVKSKVEQGIPYYDIKEYKYKQYNTDELSEMYSKLSKLEDIMEKYHCNDIEELDKKLADRDTWQKAYKLACAFLAGITQDNVCDYEDYFYQQAKNKDLEEC